MAQIQSPDLKKMAQFCSGRDLVILHRSLYRAVFLARIVVLAGTLPDAATTGLAADV